MADLAGLAGDQLSSTSPQGYGKNYDMDRFGRCLMCAGFAHLIADLPSSGFRLCAMRNRGASELGMARCCGRPIMATCLRMVYQPLAQWRIDRLGASGTRRSNWTGLVPLDEINLEPRKKMKPKNKRKLLFILCGLSALIALVWPALPMLDGPDRLSAMPQAGRVFQSQTLEFSDEDKKFLGGARAVQRIIQTQHSPPIVISVIDGSGNRHAVHDPSYCLAGGGWIIRSEKQVNLSAGVANWISMEKAGETMEALWFFDYGETQFTSPFQYWWLTSLRRTTRGLSGSEPLLVMLRVPPGGKADWQQIQQVTLPALGFP